MCKKPVFNKQNYRIIARLTKQYAVLLMIICASPINANALNADCKCEEYTKIEKLPDDNDPLEQFSLEEIGFYHGNLVSFESKLGKMINNNFVVNPSGGWFSYGGNCVQQGDTLLIKLEFKRSRYFINKKFAPTKVLTLLWGSRSGEVYVDGKSFTKTSSSCRRLFTRDFWIFKIKKHQVDISGAYLLKDLICDPKMFAEISESNKKIYYEWEDWLKNFAAGEIE